MGDLLYAGVSFQSMAVFFLKTAYSWRILFAASEWPAEEQRNYGFGTDGASPHFPIKGVAFVTEPAACRPAKAGFLCSRSLLF